MREYKFRGFDKIHNKMFNIDVLALSECTWSCPDYGKRGVSIPYQPSIEIMQYTGLKDKNGVEIYEGDILKISGYDLKDDLFKVIFNECNFSIELESLYKIHQTEAASFQKLELSLGFINDFEKLKFEIIGNIHENPELLKEV